MTQPDRFEIAGSRVHRLTSNAIGQRFRLSVTRPPGYDTSGAPYPVVFLTDGDSFLPAAVAFVPLLQLMKELPPFVTVGIGYDARPGDVGALRMRDLTPTGQSGMPQNADQEAGAPSVPPHLTHVKPGGAAPFLDFLQGDVMSTIAAHYHVDTNNATYAGYSLGGLFGLYTLFNRPEAFRRYVIGSPSIWWDDRTILNDEAAFAASGRPLDATVFMSIGELEERPTGDVHGMVRNMHALADTLTRRQYAGLDLTTIEFEDENHGSCGPLALNRGLRKVFRGDLPST